MAESLKFRNDPIRWLRCTINKGMFSNELLVTVRCGQDYLEYFVPYEKVSGQIGQTGKVAVTVHNYGSVQAAMIPTDYVEEIPVAPEDLSDSP